jgi:hypothetical protein
VLSLSPHVNILLENAIQTFLCFRLPIWPNGHLESHKYEFERGIGRTNEATGLIIFFPHSAQNYALFLTRIAYSPSEGAFAFACHVHAQSKHFQGASCGACSLDVASLCGQCYTLPRVESSGMTYTAGTKLVSRKQHNKLTAFVARVWTAQWRQPVLSVCLWGTPFSG